MEIEILNQAKATYQRGDLFLTATGNLKSPFKVDGQIKLSEHHRNTIVCESGGVIYTEGVWAKKLT